MRSYCYSVDDICYMKFIFLNVVCGKSVVESGKNSQKVCQIKNLTIKAFVEAVFRVGLININ